MRVRALTLVLAALLAWSGLAPAHVPGSEVAAAARVDRPAVSLADVPSGSRWTVDPLLEGRLANALAEHPLSGDVALSVRDEQGRTVLAQRADEALLPASLQKLVVAAAALGALGADFRFETTVAATAAPGADGVLEGDLVLVGGGDPTLATPAFVEDIWPQRPHTALEALADAVADAGIRHVTGALVGDGSIYAGQPVAEGWPQRYLTQGTATLISGLTVDAGREVFEQGGRLVSRPSEDPVGDAAEALAALLEDREVAVEGPAGAATSPPQAPYELGVVRSPPLGELLTFAVQHSDNHLTDGIFRALGRVVGDGGWASGATAVQASLAGLGLDWDGVVLADGSGLSRQDRLSAAFVSALDLRMSRSHHAQAWTEVMAVAGESGTLRRRLRDTPAEGMLRGKTGTLRDVRALSGHVRGPDGDRYHFALISNNLAADDLAAARELEDRVAVILAERLR